MSNEAQSSPAPEELRGVRLVRFISEHFAVFSLLGAVFVVLCSTLFLYGYLTVFDRQLIWIIEYPDILKFGSIPDVLVFRGVDNAPDYDFARDLGCCRAPAHNYDRPHRSRCCSDVASCGRASGGTFGTYTKYAKGLTHDVFLKDREMPNVRLVLFTSHHTVLYAGTVGVLPTSGIMKIVAHPTAQQRWP